MIRVTAEESLVLRGQLAQGGEALIVVTDYLEKQSVVETNSNDMTQCLLPQCLRHLGRLSPRFQPQSSRVKVFSKSLSSRDLSSNIARTEYPIMSPETFIMTKDGVSLMEKDRPALALVSEEEFPAPTAKPKGKVLKSSVEDIPTRDIPMLDIDGKWRELHYFDSVDQFGEDKTAAENKNILVILCGTAQSIPTWSLHTRQLAKSRRVLIPELRSQGRTTSLLVENSCLSQHVADLRQFLERVLPRGGDGDNQHSPKVDLVGFSLGGRIGLSFAEAHPSLVGSVSVTGVPHLRPYLGQLILRSWLDGLQNQEDYRKTAWSFFENGVTSKFLERNQRSMRLMVDDVMNANDARRLRHVLENALASGGGFGVSPNTHHGLVEPDHGRLRLRCPAQVIASEEDRIAGSGSELRLAKLIDEYHAHGLQCRFDKISNCGHLAPFERPAQWRKLVLDFLNSVH